MKTKLTSVTYLGYTAMDRRFSISMLPWLLREIRTTGIREKLSVAVEDGCLKAYNGNFEPIIVHRLVDILRASQVPGRPNELFYILLNEKEALLQCYLFMANTAVEIKELPIILVYQDKFWYGHHKGNLAVLATSDLEVFSGSGTDGGWADVVRDTVEVLYTI